MARRRAQRRGTRVPLPLRLRDADAAATAYRRRPRHRIAFRMGQSGIRTQGSDLQVGREKGRSSGLGTGEGPLAEFLAPRQTRTTARRAGWAALPGARTAV